MEYPYYNKHYQLSKEKFDNLINNFTPIIHHHVPKELHGKFKKMNGKFYFIEENWNKNRELNDATDFFTEECRVGCKFGKHITPLEFWNKNQNNIIDIVKKEHGKLNVNYIRDIIFRDTKLCNNFRVSIAITVLNIFKAKRWLDISAGWGDRLIAAIGYGVDFYCGVDPNDCLTNKYQTIIDTLLVEEKRNNFMVIHDGFETANIPRNDFDLVFSSPPFFDLEIYSKSEKDSMIKYNTLDKWYDDFLMVSIKKAYDHLIIGGHMVLYMGEGINTNYIHKMINDVNKFMTYLSNIYYYYPHKKFARVLFVWKK